MASGVKIKVNNVSSVVARCERAFWQKAMPIVSEQQVSDCNTYIRFQEGELAGSVSREKGYREIHWSKGYAKKVYYTGTPRRNKNPLASLRWCEVAKRAHSKEWADMATKLVNR